MLPKVFSEKFIRVYCKKEDKESIRIVNRCFLDWCTETGIKAVCENPA